MTILSDAQIRSLIKSSQLIGNHDPNNIEAASYDLRIGTILRDGQIINSAHQDHGKQILIKPGEVVTMLTLEELKLPADIAATAYAMNSQSSEGLLVLNPGHVDPGFEGPLSMVALNLRKVDLALSLGDKIFTIVFDKLDQKAQKPYQSHTTRNDRERTLNKKVVEKSMGSIGALLAINSPFATPREVKEIVRGHWTTIVTMFLTAFGTIGAIVAAIFSVVAVLHPSPAPPEAHTPNAAESKMESPIAPATIIAPPSIPATPPPATTTVKPIAPAPAAKSNEKK